MRFWIGGASEAAMKRAAMLGDAWHPNVAPMEVFGGLVARFREVSPRAKEERICVRVAFDHRAEKGEYMGPQGDRRVKLTGNMAENAKLIEELEGVGVSQAVLSPSPQGLTETKDQLEGIRAFADRFVR